MKYRAAIVTFGDESNGMLIGNGNSSPIIFGTSYQERMRITGDGKIGIGTNDPKTRLDLRSDESMFVNMTSTNENMEEVLLSLNYRVNNPYIPDKELIIGTFGANNSETIFGQSQAGKTVVAGNGEEHTGMLFGTVSSNPVILGTANQERMRITEDGKIGIGIMDVPEEYILAVKGKAIMEEIRIKLSSNWPDYVFEDNYDLMDLEELQAYIQANHHLPQIPDAAAVSENGIMIGEMNEKLLLKIEELTLYILKQQRQIDELEKQNAKINELEAKLNQLLTE